MSYIGNQPADKLLEQGDIADDSITAEKLLDADAANIRATIGAQAALPAPTTSGNVLTSNGSAWTSAALPSSESMTLLDTFATTSGTTITRSGLTLTGYKFLLIVLNGVSHNNGVSSMSVRLDGVDVTSAFGGGALAEFSGLLWLNLANGRTTCVGGPPGAGLGAVTTNDTAYSTVTTSLVFSLVATNQFDAGSIDVYGVK